MKNPKKEPQRKTQGNLSRNSISTKSIAVNKILNSEKKNRRLEVLARRHFS